MMRGIRAPDKGDSCSDPGVVATPGTANGAGLPRLRTLTRLRPKDRSGPDGPSPEIPLAFATSLIIPKEQLRDEIEGARGAAVESGRECSALHSLRHGRVEFAPAWRREDWPYACPGARP